MTRRDVLAEVLAVMEAERFAPVKPRTPERLRVPEPITPEQAEANRAQLEAALSDDPAVVAWVERGAA